MKHVAVCSAITLAVIVLLLSPVVRARPTPTPLVSVLLSPLYPTPTQPSPVTVTNFQAQGSTDLIAGIIIGLALTLVCVGVLKRLAGRGE